MCVPPPHRCVQSTVLEDASVPDMKKAAVLEALAGSDYALVVGADEHLQLLNVASQVQKVYTAS